MALVASFHHFSTVDDEGTLRHYCLGSGTSGLCCLKTGIISTPSSVVNVSCGGEFVVLVDSSGLVYSFGNNESGCLGIGNLEKCKSIQQVSSLSNIIKVACGRSHWICIDSNGQLYGCGDNTDLLALGIEEENKFSTPFLLGLDDYCVDIACGSHYSIVVNNEGEVYVAGNNQQNQLGNNGEKHQLWNKNPELQNIKSIACGVCHTLALDRDDVIHAFGDNDYGQLGREKKQDRGIEPVNIVVTSPVSSIVCGGFHSLVLEENGTLWVFGDNSYEQLGDPNYGKYVHTPTKYPVKVLAAAGGYETSIVQTDSDIRGFGQCKESELSKFGICERRSFSFSPELQNIVGTIMKERYKRVKSARK